jgi:hypothetical protein
MIRASEGLITFDNSSSDNPAIRLTLPNSFRSKDVVTGPTPDISDNAERANARLRFCL